MNISRKANGGFIKVKDEFLMAKATTLVKAMKANALSPNTQSSHGRGRNFGEVGRFVMYYC